MFLWDKRLLKRHLFTLLRLRARGALEDRLEELGVGPMRTKITDEEYESARARLADERARNVSLFGIHK